ncbi:MAG: hypothetical protein N2Z70_03690 [Bdellovibrionaceae bacterium]|jgi:hypothetical protein|nr:hypothetical protein [Pseudobdellovibrionaceae bacterium]
MPSRKERTQKKVSPSRKREIKTASVSPSSPLRKDEADAPGTSRRLRHEISSKASNQLPSHTDLANPMSQEQEISLKVPPRKEKSQTELASLGEQPETSAELAADNDNHRERGQTDDKDMNTDNAYLKDSDSTKSASSIEELTLGKETHDKITSEEKDNKNPSATEDSSPSFSSLHWLKEQFPQLSELAQTSWQIWMNEEFDRIPIQNPALRLGVKYGLKKAKSLEKQVLESPVTEKFVLSAFQLGLKAQRAWVDVEKLLKSKSKKEED